MAKILRDIKDLPERMDSIPGAKPPVFSLPYQDAPGSPEEVDEFLKLIRELRRQAPAPPR